MAAAGSQSPSPAKRFRLEGDTLTPPTSSSRPDHREYPSLEFNTYFGSIYLYVFSINCHTGGCIVRAKRVAKVNALPHGETPIFLLPSSIDAALPLRPSHATAGA